MGFTKCYACTKFEISSFTHSKFTEGFLKFGHCTLNMHRLWVFCHPSWDLPSYMIMYKICQYEVPAFTRSKDMAQTPTKSGFNNQYSLMVSALTLMF